MMLVGCTYQRPLLSVRTSSKTFIDSLANNKRVLNGYKYWELKKATYIGGFSKVVEFDSLGKKVEVGFWRQNPLNMCDGNVRYCSKFIFYSNSGEVEKITKRIIQNRGIAGKTVVNKTIYFENGKRVRIENF
jgi:hypothetical protein